MNDDLLIGAGLLAVAAVLIFIGLPDKAGVSPRFLQFEAAPMLYPPLIMAFLVGGAAELMMALQASRQRGIAGMPITPRQEPTHKCPACGGRMIVFVDMEEERKLNKFSNEKVTYFRCEQCAHFQIVEKQAASVGGLDVVYWQAAVTTGGQDVAVRASMNHVKHY